MFDDFLRNVGMTAIAIPLSVAGFSLADVPPEYLEMATDSLKTNAAIVMEYKNEPVEDKPLAEMSNYEKAEGEYNIEVLKDLAEDEAAQILTTGDTSEYEAAMDDDILLKRITPTQ